MHVKGGAGRPRRVAAAMSRRAEQSEGTRAALIEAARALFAERGYAGVGTEEIVTRARVTRGALYHHFRDKRDLFRAVHEQVESEVTDSIGATLEQGAGDDPLGALAAGARAYMDVCVEPAVARITLIEAPSVLGWAEWRQIDERYGMGIVSAGLQAAIDAGALRAQPVKPLAHLMLGALGEAGMLIANADDPKAARAEVEPAVLSLLSGLRA
jgi:AcrR family transcriptional regulator